MRLIMLVPLPLAICSDLISFFTFQISTFLSELSSLLAVDIVRIRPEEPRLSDRLKRPVNIVEMIVKQMKCENISRSGPGTR